MKASVFIATSLDGFIARANGDLDWLPAGGSASDDIENGFQEFLATVDTCVMGRHTFEKVLTLGPWPYPDKPTVVLTSRAGPPAPPGANVEFLGGAPADIAARLAERGARHVYVDGGVTIRRFLDAGLIERLIVTRIPILLGGGISLFGAMGREIPLEHVATRRYPGGLVQSEYRVAS